MEADLFDPHDAAALFAIRAINAHHPLTPAEWLAAFAAQGLLDEVDAALPLTAPPATGGRRRVTTIRG